MLICVHYNVHNIHVRCVADNMFSHLVYAENLDKNIHTDSVLNLLLEEVFSVAILFTNDTKQLTEKLTHKYIPPLMVHSSSALQGPQLRSEDISHVYATTKTTNFILPSHNHYDPGNAGVAHTRSLGFIKKHLGGPIFDLEAIWDEHTLYEFGERNVGKTMGTMVDQPYVNHIPTVCDLATA